MALRRGNGALSTSVSQLDAASSWKQEVSRLVAARQSREGLSTETPDTFAQSRQEPDSRAAQVAARVAARYAQAPSYSQLHAEACTAQQSIREAFPGPLAASTGPRLWETEAEQPVTPVQPSTEDWEPDFALRPSEPAHRVLSSHANLIEFPRELVAPRKRRPRRAEGPFAADGLERQLSIFEVDPGAFSIQPQAADTAPVWPSPEWASPEWESMELEPHSPDEPEPQSAPVPLPVLRQAPIVRRLAAALVDGVLIAAALLGSALAAVASVGGPLPAGIAKISALSGLLLAGLLYQTIFLILDNATPGMRCANLSVRAFDGRSPSRAQLSRRLGALLLSVLPMGLGVAWVLFDDDHLCWHDRLSKTYLRKG
jgi:uncharacterized RDD family membrane protein YckC